MFNYSDDTRKMNYGTTIWNSRGEFFFLQACLVIANLTHQMDCFTNLLGSIYFNPSGKLIGQMCKIPADQSDLFFLTASWARQRLSAL